ncbi:hypothetical protein FHR84_002708 [Actinopolyspora biskrensis]|uniref:Uncharacterized protein n=1 Tax=Actinopolyspora biskrensis TaxID=1470178 RepID=A0A852YW65_9ACTN|nr:hypothetical protein [Actinopolyspora biskrensis]NYH79374.1 hypothetical protein [Actinopolyspora biskrensis]
MINITRKNFRIGCFPETSMIFTAPGEHSKAVDLSAEPLYLQCDNPQETTGAIMQFSSPTKRVLSILGISIASFLAFSGASAADSFGWRMDDVTTGFESRYWEQGAGNSSVRVNWCEYDYPTEGWNAVQIEFWHNLGWAPDDKIGAADYLCSQQLPGDHAYTNLVAGKYYFMVGETYRNDHGFDAHGGVGHPA